MEHTKLPWRSNDSVVFNSKDFILFDIDNENISPQEEIEIASLVVKSVNNHQKLVDALEKMIDTFKQFRDTSNRCGDALNDAEELLNEITK